MDVRAIRLLKKESFLFMNTVSDVLFLFRIQRTDLIQIYSIIHEYTPSATRVATVRAHAGTPYAISSKVAV